MRDMYIQKGDGFVMVYSVSSAQSIDRVEELYKQISRLNEDKNVSLSYSRASVVINTNLYWLSIPCSTLLYSQGTSATSPRTPTLFLLPRERSWLASSVATFTPHRPSSTKTPPSCSRMWPSRSLTAERALLRRRKEAKPVLQVVEVAVALYCNSYFLSRGSVLSASINKLILVLCLSL
jgi:hypothetical protein